ncbi:SH3 and multiple ankyrin repeat domains protein 2-like [Clytia hemisphaerica]|uniref:SAM domain-containing protein n=1 Tax=Clytia hemisphaerica TaxID=252671 RepID=A0A7M5XQA9_9CNID
MSKFLDNDDNKDSKDDISLLQVDTHATAATTSTTNTVTPSNTKSSSLGNTGGASSSGSGRSWLMFGRKAHSCRERAPEATTIDFLEKKAVHEWDVNEVGLWLDTIGCSEYKDNFKQHDITGPELIKLERHDLNDLGVKKVGHSKRILEKSKQLARYRKVPKPSKWTRKTVS